MVEGRLTVAHVERRRLKTRVSWRVRYTDPEGHEKSRSFTRKVDAEAFATSISHQMLAGSYVDPAAGRQTLQSYLEEWRQAQSHHRPRTAKSTQQRFERMVYPHLGDVPLARLRPSMIAAWQTTLLKTYSPVTIKGVRGQLAGALNDAVLDRRLSSNPAKGVKSPEVVAVKVVPRTVEQVLAGEAAMVRRYRAVIPTVAGSGLRWSEVFGLTVDRVDFLRRTIRVDRQLTGRVRGGEPTFGPPKTASSDRTVPVGDEVLGALAAHLQRYPAKPGELIFRTSQGGALTRTVFGRAWPTAAAAMGLGRGEGLHQLRHFYASLLIADRRSVKEVQERLGHASAQETLDTYSHLFPDSDEGTRKAVDDAFRKAREEQARKQA